MKSLARAASFAIATALAIPASFATPPQAAKPSMVIVFKDGHRQVINLSDVQRVEYPTTDSAAAASANLPSRGHFLGKWRVGDGNGSDFYIVLHEDGDAVRSLGDVRGKWVYSNGEALITWNDGAQDAIRRVGSKFQKFAYNSGKSFMCRTM